MKKLLLFSIALLCSFLSFSQDEYKEEMHRRVAVPNSPEANGFTSYGGIPVDLRVGKPNVSVPLYTYKGKELDLPISLSYDMDARKVEDIASQVGLGWNLNLGGRISRMVNEKADVYSDLISGLPYLTILNDPDVREKYLEYRQIWFNHDMNNQNQNIEFDDEQDARGYFKFLSDVQEGLKDIGLDSYSINALGVNDLIKINFDSNGDPISIAVKNPRLKVERIASNDYDSWEVTDEAGTLYTFYQLELTQTRHSNDTQYPIASNYKYTSSWLLSSIISPNGKDAYEFTYTNFGYWTDDVILQAAQYIHRPHTFPTTGEGQNEIITYPKYKIEQQFLTQVTHNGDVIIDINLKARNDLANQASALESITVRNPLNTNNNSNVLKHFKFSHTYFGTGSGIDVRLKLDEIEIAGKGYDGSSNYDFESKYSFDYERSNEMPSRNSKDQDRFGFYNNANGNTELYPRWEVDGHDFEEKMGDRSFHALNAKVGILNKIHYPLGGFAEFEYGQHFDGNTNTLYDGLRVESITSFTKANEIATKKTFTYLGLVKNFDPSFTYKTYNFLDTGGQNSGRINYHRTVKAPMGDQPHISYGTVEETLVDHTNGNADFGSTTHIFYNDFTEKAGSVLQAIYPFSPDYHDAIRKGQLSSSSVKDNLGNPLSGSSSSYTESITNYYIEYSFSDYPEGNTNFVELYWNHDESKVRFRYREGSNGSPPPGGDETIDFLEDKPYGRMRPVRSYLTMQDLTSTSGNQTQILEEISVITTSTTNYDSLLNYLPSEFISSTSESNETMITKYTYPQQLLGEPQMQQLKDANRIGTPVETRSYQKVGSTETLLSTNKTTFNNWGISVIPGHPNVNIILPDEVQTAKGIVDGNNPLQSRIKYHKYDSSNGNPQEISQTHGTHSSYIWGYDGKFPVAKIENATYAEATANGLGLNWAIINNPNANGGDAALRSQLDKIRIGLPNAMVTTYTYKPHIGVSSITDPGGNSIFYHYDDENRLEYVEDKDENVLSTKKYNNRN